MRILGDELAGKSMIDLLRRDVTIISTGPSLIHEAVGKQHKFWLHAFDTIHVISAQLSGCDEILTFDNDLLKAKVTPAARKP